MRERERERERREHLREEENVVKKGIGCNPPLI
jgi:hypothetical protein